LHGFKWTALRSCGEEFIHLSVFLVLSRLLSPEDFGLISLAMIFIGFLTLFADQGFGSAVIQKKEIEKEHLDSSFWFNFGMGIVLFQLFFWGAGFIANFFDEARLGSVIKILSFSFIIKALEMIPHSVLTKNLEFKLLALRSLLAAFLAGVVGVGFALLDYGVYSLVAHRLTLSLTSVLAIWWVIDWRPSFSFSFKHLKDLWSFGINVTVFKITSNLHGKVFDGIIGYYLGATTLGYFTIAKKIAKHITTLLSKTTSRVLFPIFSKSQEQRSEINTSFNKINKQLMAFILPLLAFLAVNSSEIIRIIFGNKWVEAGPVFAVFTLWILLNLQLIFLKQILLAVGGAAYISKHSLLNLALMALGVFITVDNSWPMIAGAYTISLLISIPFLFKKSIKENVIEIMSYIDSFWIGVANSIVFLALSGTLILITSHIGLLIITSIMIITIYSFHIYLNFTFFKKLYNSAFKYG
jgi:PST family polysaccharide transporter